MDLFGKKITATTEVLKCAVYIRVSTDEQGSSIENQKGMAEYLNRNGFELYDIYTDEDLTGTETSKRLEWQRLMRDGEARKYNVLVSKSLSRFGRNQSQTIDAVHKLIRSGVRVIFLEDNLDTGNEISNFGLFAWLAENEARKTSDRIKMTWKLYNEQGRIHATHASLGYDYCKDTKNFVVNAIEVPIVQEIFSLYLDGYGANKIANMMNDKGYKSKKGKQFAGSTIMAILRNEIYIGTLVMGKSTVIDIAIKKSKKTDEADWIRHEGRVEAIIDKEVFEKVQYEIQRRSENNSRLNKREVTASLFSNLIICGECDTPFTPKRQKHFKNYSTYYSCRKYELKGAQGCGHSRNSIYEFELIEIIKDYFSEIAKDNFQSYKEKLSKQVEKAVDYKSEYLRINKEIEVLNDKSMKLLDLYTEGHIGIPQYKEQNDVLMERVDVLKSYKQRLEVAETQEIFRKKNVDESIILMKRLEDCSTWTNTALKKVIEYIKIDRSNNIEIKLK